MRSPEQILHAAGVPFVRHDHEPVSSVAEIVEALPYPAEQHVKTLVFDADGRIVLVALRGSDRLRFGPLARALGVARDRIAPLPPERVRSELGLEPGGVCPLVDAAGITVVLDRRVLDLSRAFCGSGRADATLELRATDLAAVIGATVVDVAAS
jgi:prolyl-tRNA editing enzyme YbaK/EbsC (Cys-tRNA(Pro) deacylase)